MKWNRLNIAMSLLSLLLTCAAVRAAKAVTIVPTFASSITSQSDAAAIEADVNYTVNVMNSLYNNNVTVPITFALGSVRSDATAVSSTSVGAVPYSSYMAALMRDSYDNPDNSALATAIANRRQGNDAAGTQWVLLTSSQATMLQQYGLTIDYSWGQNTITLSNSAQWTFAGPLTSCGGECRPAVNSIPSQIGTYDANQALFHEMNEILGGGGQGSTLDGCLAIGGQYCNEFGTLDLYRYAGAGNPSYSLSSTAQAYMSFDGGVSDAIGQGLDFFTAGPQDSGDFNDAGIACVPHVALIQGYSCAGTIPENYTTSSPEFAMMSAIGWDYSQCTGRTCPIMRSPGQDPIDGVVPPDTVPEPGTLWLFVAGFGALCVMKHRLLRRREGLGVRAELAARSIKVGTGR